MTDQKNIHTISLLVANKPGVLVRVALVFARRGYNIDALVVSPSFDDRYSRMTITATGDPRTLEQIIKQTAKLVDVIHSEEHKDEESLHQELALIKIKNKKANRDVVLKMAKECNAKIIDENDDVMVLVQTGSTAQLNELEQFLRKYHLIEMVRSGKLVMAKGKVTT